MNDIKRLLVEALEDLSHVYPTSNDGWDWMYDACRQFNDALNLLNEWELSYAALEADLVHIEKERDFYKKMYRELKAGPVVHDVEQYYEEPTCPSCGFKMKDYNYTRCPSCGYQLTEEPRCEVCGTTMWVRGNVVWCDTCNPSHPWRKPPAENPEEVPIICPNCKQPVDDKSDHIEPGGFDDPGNWWYACPEPPADPQEVDD